MGAIRQQFNKGNNIGIGMAPLNGSPTKLHWKWSRLYQFVAGNGVFRNGVEDPETSESLIVLDDRLAFRSRRLSAELSFGSLSYF